jgi:hypothetical protein
MSYNLDSIKRKISDLSGGRNPGRNGTPRQKLTWFKPNLLPDGSAATYEIRFLPYADRNGQPFEEVSFYDNKDLTEMRFVSPAQYGMEDPIFDLINELRKENTKETWRLTTTLRPKERFYAPLIVRGDEDKGVQIWELNSKILKDIYSILAHPDYADENMMDAENGFDFTLTVTDSGKKFNKYTVKNFDVQPRRKASKLLTSKTAKDALLASIPNLGEYFKSQVKAPEWIRETVENFLAKQSGSSENDTGADAVVEEANASSKTVTTAARGPNRKQEQEKAVKDIEDAFADLDDDDDM